jgi:hypothetical protein
MKSLATTVGYLAWFVSQYIGTVLLGILIGGREKLNGQILFSIFIIHSIFWGVMQIGSLHARMNKTDVRIQSIQDRVFDIPSYPYDPTKW